MQRQTEIKRLLKYIVLASTSTLYKANELAERLEVERTTIYRYKDMLTAEGFVFNPTRGIIQIDVNKGMGKKLSELLIFSPEEAQILQQAIFSIDDNSVIKTALIDKLYSLFDTKRIYNEVINKQRGITLQTLSKAIESGQRVLLKNYHSPNSNSITNREIEPFDFTPAFQAIWAVDCADKQVKQFKLARAEKAEMLPQAFTYKHLHQLATIDPFRMSGNHLATIQLKLSMRATELLHEEYPLAAQYVQCNGKKQNLYAIPICGFEGIGRFVLGLPGEVEVINSPQFVSYLKDKLLTLKF